MKNLNRIVILLTIFYLQSPVIEAQILDVNKEFRNAASQYKGMLADHQDIKLFPQSLFPDGKSKNMPSWWWCSGFFGGSLWYIYEYTHDPAWKDTADRWSMAVSEQKSNTHTHDLGFMLFCSLGNGYRLTGDERYKQVLMQGAKSLASRFNPDYGVIKSWDEWKGYNYPVIIDNMMNLELLLWSAKASGNEELKGIAISHADKTLNNHFRKDFSTYHVVCYGPGGKVLAKKTSQGFSDSSAWARGQGWGLYGYTTMYRFTHQKKYLYQAEQIARFILNHPNLPEDKIPYWDFNAPKIPNEERDASAGALIASGLFELSQYSRFGKTYFEAAKQILTSLAGSNYTAALGTNGNFILKHSVGAKPQNSEVDTPIVYADYYYLEALLRYDQLIKNKMIKFL